jgi:putative CocE/NonD family hydrolase
MLDGVGRATLSPLRLLDRPRPPFRSEPVSGGREISEIETIENVFITLNDGTRLAARLWLPPKSMRPAPAVLEYIPYRKRDGTRWRDEPMHGYFAARGFAAVRVDMRGSGDSEGVLEDEYLKLEQDDGLEIIAWIAAQAWCDAAVAMIGNSWGGFNALQIAARRPPALRAIIPVCFTDDRYADDVHYLGGCLLNDNLWWGATMLAYQARPPDPRIVGERWREMWRQRLDAMPFWPAVWLSRQRRVAYWKRGSVCEDWSAIETPTLAVGGWADGYSNAVPRLLANFRAPALGIIGPWAHVYPHDGSPGPAIGFLQEAVRFLDFWLRGRENGVMSEPKLRAYIEDWSEPTSWGDHSPGRWVGESSWPSTGVSAQPFFLGEQGLTAEAQPAGVVKLRSKFYVGAGAGEWMGAGVIGEAPTDQRFDDGLSLCLDSEPLRERLELLGAPTLELEIASDKPVAQVCVRLMAVAPTGASRRLSFGALNLTHRDSHECPQALEPGRFYRARLQLNDCGCSIPPGFRVRLALSSAYWPMIWPAPEAATLTLRTAGSKLALPARPNDDEGARVAFDAPEQARQASVTLVKPGRATRTFSLDLVKDIATYRSVGEGGVFGQGVLRFDGTMTSLTHDVTREFVVNGDEPLSARHTVTQRYVIEWPGTEATIESAVELSSNATQFHLTGRLDVYENGHRFASRRFYQQIARDML